MAQPDPKRISIVEADIATLRLCLDSSWVTSVELVSKYLQRIQNYDGKDKLNSIPVINPSVFRDAAASDSRRANGEPLGPLEGIPFTVKDSYKVEGITVASGSPAFKDLIASEDAFTVKMLKEAGAILIGKTNMPPLAAGGMQEGLYGRAESPYNSEYLTAAFGSGSSNGSATSTAASFAAFGMGEETVSSGRSPASNNGLVAYTPSRGVISIRGNWTLFPTCDVVVPHTRTVGDMLEILDVLVQKDEVKTGDFWREQPFVQIPDVESLRPKSHKDSIKPGELKGRRLGVQRMYIEKDGMLSGVKTRQSILDLFENARTQLEALGAETIECNFPLMEKYDTQSGAPPTTSSDQESNGITDSWNAIERMELISYAWDDFLIQNNDPNIASLASVDPSTIFPRLPNSLPDRYNPTGKPIFDFPALVSCAKTRNASSIFELPGMALALQTLENRRKFDFEMWLREQGFDALVFPANADVGKADTNTNEVSADEAWRNGVMYSNGNRVLRHLGIPSVSVTMGTMADTKMPVNLTFIGKAYEDVRLLGFAFDYERASKLRKPPGEVEGLESDFIVCSEKSVSAVSEEKNEVLLREVMANSH